MGLNVSQIQHTDMCAHVYISITSCIVFETTILISNPVLVSFPLHIKNNLFMG